MAKMMIIPCNTVFNPASINHPAVELGGYLLAAENITIPVGTPKLIMVKKGSVFLDTSDAFSDYPVLF
jgi:hypothetical protein